MVPDLRCSPGQPNRIENHAKSEMLRLLPERSKRAYRFLRGSEKVRRRNEDLLTRFSGLADH